MLPSNASGIIYSSAKPCVGCRGRLQKIHDEAYISATCRTGRHVYKEANGHRIPRMICVLVLLVTEIVMKSIAEEDRFRNLNVQEEFEDRNHVCKEKNRR
uniref:CMP/dCMP-type deaminase domain-containing protein n=1 Tax=Steinernema glaseri TaxID=37863 RepID=A0A1I7YQ93_9BILA